MAKAEPSSKLARMRFMQRPVEAELRRKLQEEQQQHIRDSHWVVQQASRSLISLEESILFDKYTSGRRSFQGFNPQIETMNLRRTREEALAEAKKGNTETRIVHKQEAGIPDEEFAQRYQETVTGDITAAKETYGVKGRKKRKAKNTREKKKAKKLKTDWPSSISNNASLNKRKR